MNTRQIATRDEVKRFMLANSNRTERSLGSTIAKIGLAAVLVTGFAAVTSYSIFSRRAPISIMVDGSTAMKQNGGFCAIRCSKSGKGAFYSNDTVYIEDYSQNNKYWKKFYDRKSNLLVEGRGNDNERWFFNPDYMGEPHLAKAVKVGNTWYTNDYYRGEEAAEKWKEVKTKF